MCPEDIDPAQAPGEEDRCRVGVEAPSRKEKKERMRREEAPRPGELHSSQFNDSAARSIQDPKHHIYSASIDMSTAWDTGSTRDAHVSSTLSCHMDTRSTLRRLRKMSHDYAPSQFRFDAQPQVLCVGNAVVFRVVVQLDVATSYGFAWQQPTRHKWMLALSQAKVQWLCVHVNHLVTRLSFVERLQHEGSEWKPLDQLIHTLRSILNGYGYLYAAFALPDRRGDTNHARSTATTFLGECWQALETILPVVALESRRPLMLGHEILRLYAVMRDFLGFPDTILSASFVYANAVMSIEDVDGHPSSVAIDQECTICLESLRGLSEASAFPAESNCVQLPCRHFFHENCILAWLRCNPSCPQCRSWCGGTPSPLL